MAHTEEKPGSTGRTAERNLPGLEALVRGEYPNPFEILGPHWIERHGHPHLAIRGYRPGATEMTIVATTAQESYSTERIHAAGAFEGLLPADLANAVPGEAAEPGTYRLRFRFEHGAVEAFDPYAFPALLTDFDLHLFTEGTHYLKYEKLGAHVRDVDGVRGVHFALWAPNALRASVVGDFNGWDGRAHAMRPRTGGLWEIFVTGLDEGAIYKFEILSSQARHLLLKSDPYGFRAEVRPNTASVVCNIDGYRWQDAEWLAARATPEIGRASCRERV